MESKQEDINRSITLNGQYWKIKAKLIAHYGLELHYMNKYSILVLTWHLQIGILGKTSFFLTQAGELRIIALRILGKTSI